MSQELLAHLRRHFSDLDRIPDGCIITGGPVRDALMGRSPADLDLACLDAETSAESFRRDTSGRRVTLGTRFQTERVLVGATIYDFSPMFGGSIREDLGRRDFTINAIGLTLEGNLIDPFEGADDLQHRVLRMVDESNFEADPLRVLRAVRFAVGLGLAIDESTADACRAHGPSLSRVAGERITHELRLILQASRSAASLLSELELDRVLFDRPLTDEDAQGWNRLTAAFPPDRRVVAILSLLVRDRPPVNEPSPLWSLSWTREEIRTIRDTVAILQTGDDPERLLLSAARHGRNATETAAAVFDSLGSASDAGALREVLRREPSPFDIRVLLDGNEIAELTGAEGHRIGELKSSLWSAQITGKVRTLEEARSYLVERASDTSES